MSERYILVTGASTGIGRATALHLDKQGFHVFAGVRKTADGESLRAEASQRLQPIILDVTKCEQIAAAREQITATVGDKGLYGLVNNAGINVASPIEFLPIDELRFQLEVNLIGQVAVTQAMLPLIRKVLGRIINISSISGRLATVTNGAYTMSKFALEALTDTLRLELKPWNIEVVSIQPGAIASAIWKTSVARADELLGRIPESKDLYLDQIEKAYQWAAETEKRAIPALEVAKVVEQALTTKHPKTRYLVGRDAKLLAWLRSLLSDRLWDRLILSQ
jgi:NAD(P)-dependent dehydrogenase (short-subunit alcohol dehydrogenase family)